MDGSVRIAFGRRDGTCGIAISHRFLEESLIRKKSTTSGKTKPENREKLQSYAKSFNGLVPDNFPR